MYLTPALGDTFSTPLLLAAHTAAAGVAGGICLIAAPAGWNRSLGDISLDLYSDGQWLHQLLHLQHYRKCLAPGNLPASFDICIDTGPVTLTGATPFRRPLIAAQVSAAEFLIASSGRWRNLGDHIYCILMVSGCTNSCTLQHHS